MSSYATRNLLEHNIAFLLQVRTILPGLDDDAYSAPHPPAFRSTAGAHLRHVLDHYLAFLRDLPEGRIDFDRRNRDARIETDRLHAVDVVDTITGNLSRLPPADHPLQIRMDSDLRAADDVEWTDSTVNRELQYLAAHTVHHFALIRSLLTLKGAIVPEEFGIAPSTMRHRRSARLLAG